MKTAVSSIIVQPKFSLADGMRELRSAGFDGVDFSVCNYSMPDGADRNFRSDNWKNLAEYISSAIKDVGLSCTQAHATWGHQTDLSEFVPPEEILFRQIDISVILGTEYLVFHPVLPKKKVTSLAEKKAFTDYSVRWFSPLVEYAEKRGVTLCVENVFADFGNEPSDGLYPFGDAESLSDVVDRIKSERFGVCLDTGHANLHVGGGLVSMINELGSRIKALHINDNAGRITPLDRADLHLAPTGAGIDIDGIAAALRSANFKGTVSLEVVDRTPSVDLLRAELAYSYAVARHIADIIQETPASDRK